MCRVFFLQSGVWVYYACTFHNVKSYFCIYSNESNTHWGHHLRSNLPSAGFHTAFCCTDRRWGQNRPVHSASCCRTNNYSRPTTNVNMSLNKLMMSVFRMRTFYWWSKTNKQFVSWVLFKVKQEKELLILLLILMIRTQSSFLCLI